MLEVSDVTVTYGQHRALTDAALNVAPGEIVVILGANGAGKSSLLKAIAGIVPSSPGKRVSLAGRDLSELPAHRIVEAGLALVPEGRRLFPKLTVAENLMLGAFRKAAQTKGRPSVIVAKTVKGYPIQNLLTKDLNHHGKPLTKEEAEKALAEIGT